VVSMQVPLQEVSPPVQPLVWHAPLTQAWPEAQARPQPPQFCALLVVLVHCPLQICCPLAQLVEQVPLEQAWPLAQAWPQLPQLFGSVLVLVQA
jgi:hypothetical protein